ncbi:Oxidoreductase swnR [Colletotrichum gloeosporioides]|uniref:Oxidoreductase swnR n=1 Tax=Colletotrichum gloeosporioides TaxID=474922 RepID=A0A8H4C9U2_COLGL|nr:Oxidoreductase swnR [Colletotrichum gloeosporioides]KAF3799990.1 Oxidoreductase swnR [Colletotrichum gloeosporioides]
MKVAVAGAGDIAKYLVEALRNQDHDVVILTRSPKPFFESLEQRMTDYSLQSIRQHLADCDALISSITGYATDFVRIHLDMLEACRTSPRCKSFLPSVWAGNYEEVPDQPIYVGDDLSVILNKLRAQDEVKWTFFCQGWMSDYLLPTSQRHFADYGDRWVQNYEKKEFTLYGNGSQKVDFTSARDATRAVAVLMNHDPSTWENFTCVSGQQMTWLELSELVKIRFPEYNVVKKSLAQSIKQLVAKESDASVAVAVYEIMGHSEALAFSPTKIAEHRKKYFRGLKFRTVEELLDEAASHPTSIA